MVSQGAPPTGSYGVRVNGVRPGGPADDAKPSLADDDVIVSFDGNPIANVEALAAETDG